MATEAIAAMRANLRSGTANAPSCSHPGLILARYLPERGTEGGAASLLADVSEATATDAYRVALNRWRELHRASADRVVFTGVAQEPIGVGLGSASALEVGLTLQHTYGMPMLPGRALKGLCRRAVATLGREQALPEGTVETLFGTTSSASYGVLWDAWYDPSEDAVGPFKRDVVTVHHRDYYGKKEGRPWPSDFDDPIPVPFLVVRPGSRFLFVVQMPDGKWLDFVKCALQWGLENLGIGGKTNAGYGRLGEWSELPRPPQIETWTDCELRLNNVKGVISVAITGGPEPLVIQQNRWQPIAQTWPPEWRETFKKKRVAHASLKIERDGSKLTLLDVLPDTIRF